MSTIIDKSQMTEEDIKLNYITPALLDKGWKNKITMETAVKLTDGKINLRGNLVVRAAPKKADYILYINANNPIAVAVTVRVTNECLRPCGTSVGPFRKEGAFDSMEGCLYPFLWGRPPRFC